MTWETVIGLEIHAQLATDSKIFSGAATAYGAEPNTQACSIDLGMPGILPVLNQQAVKYALRFGLSIDAQIADRTIFARKNYFYPDLPKGYQISQYEQPIVGLGQISIELNDGSKKIIGITRAHLEEDAGKSIHKAQQKTSGIDLNRAGTPLLEIVSEPDMRSAEEAIAYLKKIHQLVRYLGISDGNMQEGSFRCDVNISLRKHGAKEFGTRAEIKNVNSFRFVEHAINFEVERQAEILEAGGKIIQETRLYDPDLDETRSMRGKEEAHDYRYFPDPDLLPLDILPEWIAEAKSTLPELPWIREQRFVDTLDLSRKDAQSLSQQREVADYFETVLKHTESDVKPKMAANWINGEVSAYLNKHQLQIAAAPVSPTALAKLLNKLASDTISNSAAKTVFATMWDSGREPTDIIKELGLEQVSDSSELETLVDEIIANNPQQVADYRAGKTKLMAFFVGQMMKATRGKANPKTVNKLLQEKLSAKE